MDREQWGLWGGMNRIEKVVYQSLAILGVVFYLLPKLILREAYERLRQ